MADFKRLPWEDDKKPSAINHLEIALSWLDDETLTDGREPGYVFALTEIGYAIRDLPSDGDSYWFIKEDFYGLASLLIFDNPEDKEFKDEFRGIIEAMIDRVEDIYIKKYEKWSAY
jgi:hypothetical protein